MNTEVTTAIDEQQSVDKPEERPADTAIVELGVVSTDTRGGFGSVSDGGMFKQF